MWIINGLIADFKTNRFEQRDIEIKDGRIAQIVDSVRFPKSDAEVLDAKGSYVLPGLVDVHFHGCAGHDFCEGTQDAFKTIEQYEISHGMTTLCPATMTLPVEQLHMICEAAAQYIRSEDNRAYVGLHLEGPMLSEAKKGAQKSDHLQQPSAALIRELNESAEGYVKIVSLAPELSGGIECIQELTGTCGIRCSIAHTEADYDTASLAIKAGADHVTHLYNAMPPFSHRNPGVIGAAFDHGASVELICDGIHIHSSVIRATFRMFGSDRMLLISDSMMAAGMPDGDYELGGQPVTVCGNKAVITGSSTIAGSVTNLYDCMRFAIQSGIEPIEAVRAASFNPAKSIGIQDRVGSIEVGKQADLLIADEGFRLDSVYKNGNRVIDK